MCVLKFEVVLESFVVIEQFMVTVLLSDIYPSIYSKFIES